jgi:hypothetical protein
VKALLIAIVLLSFAAGAAAAITAPQPPWKGLPVRTTAAGNKPGDPINIAFEGTESGILAAFGKIDWLRADPLSTEDDLRLAMAALRNGKYPRAPVSNLYLFGRAEDFAVEHELGSVSSRDHARFWDTARKDPVTHLELWIGDCSRDIAIKILRTKHGLPRGTTHRIDGHLDVERNLIVDDMKNAHLASAVIMEPGIGHVANLHNSTGDQLFTDGQAAVVVLR